MSTVGTRLPEAAPAARQPTLCGYAGDQLARLRAGQMGSLPAVFALLVLSVSFGVMRPVFLTALNFANLFTQGAAVTVIAMGLIFVLLLGEIDLSAGFASGVCAAVLAVLLVDGHWPWYLAILGAVAVGAAIGTALGVLVAKVGIPSFVVTLAAFLAFQGIALLLIKGGQNVTIDDPAIQLINYDGKLPPAWGWLLYAVTVGAYATAQLRGRHNRVDRGLAADPLPVTLLRVGVLAGVLGAAVYVFNLERGRNPLVSQRGVPVVVVIIGVLLVFWAFVLDRTAYGRHLYAVGGNREAARRAGIHVDRIRISVFVICSSMAAVGGVIAASQAQSVDANTGGSNVLLYAMGAAVIGGTSLFGGRGGMLDAVLGGAVVAVINNGMGLMGYSSGIKFIVTGSVLLLAATVDALSRRRARVAGVH